MKVQTKIIIFFFATFTLILKSCEKKSEKADEITTSLAKTKESTISSHFKSNLRPDENLKLKKIYTDTVEFINFDDNGDDSYFNVLKNNDTIGLIYNNDDPQLTRGDLLEIHWKMDSLRPAGDPEYLDYSEDLVSLKIIKPLILNNKKAKFLWRENRYDEKLKAEFSTIIFDENYLKNITEPEKAALAYAATFIGNECKWDGKADDRRGNLKCKILGALYLGYQCSEQHLSFLRFWFRNDRKILKELENCPTTPEGSTIQDTFDEINIETSGNRITVSFKANGINLREGKAWNWSEKQSFEFKGNHLVLLKKDVSPIVHSIFKVQGN